MGYTHHDKIVGVNGVFTGAKGSEVKVADGGVLYKGTSGSEVAITGNEGIITVSMATGSELRFARVPYQCTWTGYACYAVSAGTGRAVTITLGSAGAEQGTTGAVGALGTIGQTTVITNSAGSTLAAGQILGIALGTCATAQTDVTVVLALTKA